MGLKKAWPITLQERLPVPLEVDLIWWMIYCANKKSADRRGSRWRRLPLTL